MSDPLSEIRTSFFVECEELLESLFDALQAMSDGDPDSETVNTAFRAVHSIKGGAGAFALEDLVAFTHHFETLMDHVRSGAVLLDTSLIQFFFRCGDILSDIVRAARDGQTADPASVAPVVVQLRSYTSTAQPPVDARATAFQPMPLDLDDIFLEPMEPHREATVARPIPVTPGSQRPEHIRVVFRPEPELYQSGNEPLFLLRSLEDLGACRTSVSVNPCSHDRTPGAGLTWTVDIETRASPVEAEQVFEFVQGLCGLTIEKVAGHSAGDGQPVPTPVPRLRPDKDTIDAPPDFAAGMDDRAKELSPTATSRPAASPTVRVDLGRVDRLVNLVGELVINQAMLSQSATEADLPSSSSISSGLDELQQLTRDIQESVMMIRAQPVKSLFQRMSRIVREASMEVGKQVDLVTDGEGTEIDKTVIERLADPLTHIIRNAVDHGFEETDDRLAAGKPVTGEIRLSAAHRSGRVIIEIADDGRGIDRDKVHRIAIGKGLVEPVTALSEAEIDQILFLPGFSTADRVSNLSGRGVGMDVVKTAITSLGGRIAIQSSPGCGTTITISLPLTLAVLDGMVVSVSGETLVVPLSAIAETLTLNPGNIRPFGASTNVVLVRESFVPLLDLGVELGYRAPLESYDGSIALLVGHENGSKAALVVDTIQDQRQVVIKGLQDSYGQVPGVAAATILGDGRIALILDPSDLVRTADGISSPPIVRKAG